MYIVGYRRMRTVQCRGGVIINVPPYYSAYKVAERNGRTEYHEAEKACPVPVALSRVQSVEKEKKTVGA